MRNPIGVCQPATAGRCGCIRADSRHRARKKHPKAAGFFEPAAFLQLFAPRFRSAPLKNGCEKAGCAAARRSFCARIGLPVLLPESRYSVCLARGSAPSTLSESAAAPFPVKDAGVICRGAKTLVSKTIGANDRSSGFCKDFSVGCRFRLCRFCGGSAENVFVLHKIHGNPKKGFAFSGFAFRPDLRYTIWYQRMQKKRRSR